MTERSESDRRLSEFLLRLHGLPRVNYAIDVSADLLLWNTIKTVSAPDGLVDYRDDLAVGTSVRFYRARQTSP